MDDDPNSSLLQEDREAHAKRINLTTSNYTTRITNTGELNLETDKSISPISGKKELIYNQDISNKQESVIQNPADPK